MAVLSSPARRDELLVCLIYFSFIIRQNKSCKIRMKDKS